MPIHPFRTSNAVVRPELAGGYAVAILAGSGLGIGTLVVLAAIFDFSLSPLTWYLARSSGITLYLLLWFSVVAGLGLTTSLLDRVSRRGTIFSVHQYATSLAYGFLALHLLSLAADPTVTFELKDFLVPFAASLGEPWTGLGVLAAELLFVIGASFGLRRLIGYRAWRVLHWTTFPLFALALAHGVGAGTDTHTVWARALYLTTSVTVVWLAAYRALRGGARGRSTTAAPTAPVDRVAAHASPARSR
jgi:sulfoxide reductase heme-binding subunit YedZ